MQFIKTQKILYNKVPRIRLISENADNEYIRLIRKLPDCRWSQQLGSWHTGNISDHIRHFNTIFPSHIRFYDISNNSQSLEVNEKTHEKRIVISRSKTENCLRFNFHYDRKFELLLQKHGGTKTEENQYNLAISDSCDIQEELLSYLEKRNYQIDFLNDAYTDISNKKTQSLIGFKAFLETENYSLRTQMHYYQIIRKFLLNVNDENCLDQETIKDYLETLSIKYNYSRSYQNLQINSIKAYYRFIHGHNLDKNKIHRPSRKPNPPRLISRNEASAFIEKISNFKHNTIINIIYLCGISANDISSLKLKDFNPKLTQLTIQGREGRLLRILDIPKELSDKIQHYVDRYQPEYYLFEGYAGKPYSVRAIQKAIKRNASKAGGSYITTNMLKRNSEVHFRGNGGKK